MSPRAGLDRDRVVRAAIAILNRDGAGSLSMGRLAAELGVQTPSLYNHIAGLSDLYRELALENARRLGGCLAEAAAGVSGAAAMLALARAYRAYIKNNPGLYLSGLRASRNQQPFDAELAAVEERAVRPALAVVASFGLAGPEALHAVRGLRSLVHGFTTIELAGGFGLPLDLDQSFDSILLAFTRGLTLSG